MKLSQEEFDKLNELEEAILYVEKLSEILFEYDDEKEILIDILYEKSLIMKNKLNNFVNLLTKE